MSENPQSEIAPPPPLPAQGLAYATPFGAANEIQGVWREGAQLVTTTMAALPHRCVKCNAEADGSYKERSFSWHHPALYLLIIMPGILIYAIVALIVRKKAVVRVGLCRTHRKQRIRLMTVTWLLGLVILPIIIGGFIASDAYRQQWIGFVGLFGGIVFLIIAIVTGVKARNIVPSKITEQYAWFSGAGMDFLSQLPPAR